MENHSGSKRFKFGKIIIAILLCLFCSFSFVGCVGRLNMSGGSSSGSSSGGNSSSGGSSNDKNDKDDSDDESSEDSPSIDDYNDVFLGAIGVYEIDGTEAVFYDKYKKELVSYNDLIERQFDTIATYLYNSLYRIYGANGGAASFAISGFGDSKTLEYASLISNADQKILTGLSTGILENKEYLNYTNAINGGYSFSATDNGDGTFTTTYNTVVTLTENAWIGKDYFNINSIKKALGYIYTHQQPVANANGDLAFTSDTALKNYYVNDFNLSNTEITNFDLKTINNLGITNEFIWNVSYYVAYSLIGQTNMDNSINNYNTIFSGSKITTLTTGNLSTLSTALEKYKGYNLVLADIITDIMELNVASNTTLSIVNSNWETTCFPSLKKEMYIYYDKIEDVCDANNEDLFDDSGDEDFDLSEDEEYDESEMDNIDVGTAFKLKKIILVPYIDITKNNISSFEMEGLLLGFQSETANTYKVDFSISGLDKSGNVFNVVDIETSGGDNNIEGNKVIYDDTYLFSEDLVDVSFALGTQLSTLKTLTGEDIKTLITGSFKSDSRTVNYISGGSKTIGIGYINVYNNLIDKDGVFNAKSSLLELNFNYYSSNDTKLTEIPSTYLMYFYIF